MRSPSAAKAPDIYPEGHFSCFASTQSQHSTPGILRILGATPSILRILGAGSILGAIAVIAPHPVRVAVAMTDGADAEELPRKKKKWANKAKEAKARRVEVIWCVD